MAITPINIHQAQGDYCSASSKQIGAKWGAIAAGILLLGALGVGAYFGVQTHLASGSLLKSLPFKIALISSASLGLLTLTLLVMTIYQRHQKQKAADILTPKNYFTALNNEQTTQPIVTSMSDKELKNLLLLLQKPPSQITKHLFLNLAAGGLERLLDLLVETDYLLTPQDLTLLAQNEEAKNLAGKIVTDLETLKNLISSLQKGERREAWILIASIVMILLAVALGHFLKSAPLPVPIGIGAVGGFGLTGIGIFHQYLESQKKKQEQLEARVSLPNLFYSIMLELYSNANPSELQTKQIFKQLGYKHEALLIGILSAANQYISSKEALSEHDIFFLKNITQQATKRYISIDAEGALTTLKDTWKEQDATSFLKIFPDNSSQTD
ncbi:MAG: hypothetical protein K940chlam9_00681 [Chlamydiae bacterium]|nr:hypothetical protein [Chlamydiota bacterium]